MKKQATISPKKQRRLTKRDIQGYILLAPFAILFILFIVIPIIWSIFVSFTNYDIVKNMTWAGLSNYITLFTDDEIFLTAVKNTLVFAAISGPVGFLCSFFFAWVINSLKGKRFYALAFYVPSIVSAIAVSVIWLYLFSSDR